GPGRRVYKLTDHLNRTPEGRQWGERVKHAASGLSPEDEDGSIRCYGSPTLAVLMNPLYERFRLPRLWETTQSSWRPRPCTRPCASLDSTWSRSPKRPCRHARFRQFHRCAAVP